MLYEKTVQTALGHTALATPTTQYIEIRILIVKMGKCINQNISTVAM
jgi:hypothetical protein